MILPRKFDELQRINLHHPTVALVFHYYAMQQLITEKQQAARLRVCERHLINLRNKRLIPYIKLGRSIRYDPAAVERAIQKLSIKELNSK